MTSQFSDMTSTSNFFDVVFFLLSFLVTDPSFMSILSLVLELWQFSFIRDWLEIRKSEIPTSEFFPIPGDWGELWIRNLAPMSLIECYWMLQNSRVTAFTVFELLRENQLWRGVKLLPPTQIRVKILLWLAFSFLFSIYFLWQNILNVKRKLCLVDQKLFFVQQYINVSWLVVRIKVLLKNWFASPIFSYYRLYHEMVYVSWQTIVNLSCMWECIFWHSNKSYIFL